MRRILFGVWTVLALCGASRADIIVSGDLNIGNGINGSSGAPVGDNGAFFANVLGAGTKVVLQEGFAAGSAADAYTSIANFYTGRGDSVDAISTGFAASDLSGASLLISAVPLSAYTASEVSLMSSFLAAGNTVFFMGENGGFAEGVAGNAFINSALTSLGSGLSLVNAQNDAGFHTGTGAQIAANSLTSGVNSFVYADASEVLGGTPLFFTTSGAPFLAVEKTGTVPEPSTAIVFLTGLVGLAALRRR